MRRHLALVACAGLILALSIAPLSLAGQSRGTPTPPRAATPAPTPAKAGPAPRTRWGDPDLGGVWMVMYGVPLERAQQYAGREFLTDAEVAELDKQKSTNEGRNTRSANAAQDVNGAYNAVFNSILKTGKRTSMIIDPKDGRIPPLTEEAQARQGRGGRGAAAAAGRGGRGAGNAANPGGAPQAVAAVDAPPNEAGRGQRSNGPEDVGNIRCLGVQTPFLPLNTAFAQGTVMRLVQSPKAVSIYMEDDHAGGGTRVIPIDGSPHLPSNIRLYLGDSRGHWEGSTLVIETTNFEEGRTFRGAMADTFKMTERITRVDSKNLRREVTFEDPKTWTRPWTVLVDMGRADDTKQMIFDSACHEGNYGLTGILVGSRMEEKAEAATRGTAK